MDSFSCGINASKLASVKFVIEGLLNISSGSFQFSKSVLGQTLTVRHSSLLTLLTYWVALLTHPSLGTSESGEVSLTVTIQWQYNLVQT